MKQNKQTNIEAENLLEEAASIIEPCTRCGQCKGLCPAFKTILQEEISPRGHAATITKKTLEKAVYQCTMCKACEQECPLHIKICSAIEKTREALVLKRKGTKKGTQIQENNKKYGKPLGKNPEEMLK